MKLSSFLRTCIHSAAFAAINPRNPKAMLHRARFESTIERLQRRVDKASHDSALRIAVLS